MGTYEWMELESLNSEIAASRSRLVAARNTRDVGRAAALEEEIAAAEARRDKLLAHITTNLVTAPGPAPERKAAAAAAAKSSAAADAARAVDPAPPVPPEPAAKRKEAAESGAAPAEPEAAPPPAPEPEDGEAASLAAPPASARQANGAKGGSTVWEQLKPSDLEHARRQLDARRAEMLARHAEELKTLESDQEQLDVLERAISAFADKFIRAGTADGVINLENKRDQRQQSAG